MWTRVISPCNAALQARDQLLAAAAAALAHQVALG